MGPAAVGAWAAVVVMCKLREGGQRRGVATSRYHPTACMGSFGGFGSDPSGEGDSMPEDEAGAVARLFSQEVPEIAAGTVEIKAIAREPGYRSKLAVCS